jgi:hypothetical protein
MSYPGFLLGDVTAEFIGVAMGGDAGRPLRADLT